MFFPIATLGTIADEVSDISPLKMALNTIFQIIYDNNFRKLWNNNWNFACIFNFIFMDYSQKI